MLSFQPVSKRKHNYPGREFDIDLVILLDKVIGDEYIFSACNQSCRLIIYAFNQHYQGFPLSTVILSSSGKQGRLSRNAARSVPLRF